MLRLMRTTSGCVIMMRCVWIERATQKLQDWVDLKRMQRMSFLKYPSVASRIREDFIIENYHLLFSQNMIVNNTISPLSPYCHDVRDIDSVNRRVKTMNLKNNSTMLMSD